jgi:hypothetical protein
MAQLRKGSLIRFADRDSGTPVRSSTDPALGSPLLRRLIRHVNAHAHARSAFHPKRRDVYITQRSASDAPFGVFDRELSRGLTAPPQ